MEKLARRLKALFRKNNPIVHEDEVPPEVLAFRDFIGSFPHPIRVLMVRPEPSQIDSHSEAFTLIRMDVCDTSTNSAAYFSALSVSEIHDHVPEIQSTFGIANTDLLTDLKPFSFINRESKYFGHFVPYSVSEHLDEFAAQLFGFFGDQYWGYIQARYRKEADYNERFDLQPDPILSSDELLRPHPFSVSMVHADGNSLSIEEWQEHVANMQLIPFVPEDVKSTFEVAKRLYVFGYFEWRFFTISQHYAYLALEAAVHARWSRTLPEKVLVEFGNGVKTQFPRTTHKQFYDHWKVDRKLKINGESFPDSMNDLLRSLLRKKIIKKWQFDRIQTMIDLRNELSHLEQATVIPPNAGAIRFAAELINSMFDDPNSCSPCP